MRLEGSTVNQELQNSNKYKTDWTQQEIKCQYIVPTESSLKDKSKVGSSENDRDEWICKQSTSEPSMG